ncbi:MAG: TRAP transporter permease, partial [Burkholderiaceae bacterium]
SGSSVSNVVSGGIFTIPLMKKAGYGGVKAGAIETMSSVNGQIMPPVMGAAAFLMVEYVGIPYAEIVKHALLPAILSYLGLFYIVHLEALKLGMQPIVKREYRPRYQRWIRVGIGVSGSVILIAILYYALAFIKYLLGHFAIWGAALFMLLIYLMAINQAARSQALPQDIDIDNPQVLDTWTTVKAGLHYLLPIGTLIWCLMIEELSPSLSAFWAVVVLITLMITQKPCMALIRKEPMLPTWREGLHDLVGGFHDGARNMVGIGIATATAGIIVGGITLTGLGLRMTDFVEAVAQGNVLIMLLFIAFVCLVLGLGVPTTANYVLVATLMAPVVVELGAQSGLVIPLIAVHLFVFYYGIMGDITPPVGLATFAAAAISGEDAIKTGMQGARYALRTVILPFIWIFNPQLLLIDVNDAWELIRVVAACSLAMLVFGAVSMNWFRVKNRLWENLLLSVAVILLFRPDLIMNQLKPPLVEREVSSVYEVVQHASDDSRLVFVIRGMNLEGADITKTLALNLGVGTEDGRKRLSSAGIQLMSLGGQSQISAVRFGSQAQKAGFEQGWEVVSIMVPAERPTPHWFYLPALLLVLVVWFSQGFRMRRP